eukprot:5685533-Prymnesium_polylepis.1
MERWVALEASAKEAIAAAAQAKLDCDEAMKAKAAIAGANSKKKNDWASLMAQAIKQVQGTKEGAAAADAAAEGAGETQRQAECRSECGEPSAGASSSVQMARAGTARNAPANAPAARRQNTQGLTARVSGQAHGTRPPIVPHAASDGAASASGGEQAPAAGEGAEVAAAV